MDALAVDVDLCRALSANDRRRAGTLLVTHYASDVFALCRAIVRDRDVAEDLAQDAFQKALVALPSFRGESSARTWLLSIARNRCLDHLRSARSSPFARDQDGETDAHPSPDAPVLDLIVRREDVERALAPLDETERAIVVLFHGHGVGYPELAEAFGLREGAVRMRMSRATAKMRDALGADGAAQRPSREPQEEDDAALEESLSAAPARRARAGAASATTQRQSGGLPPRAAAPTASGTIGASARATLDTPAAAAGLRTPDSFARPLGAAVPASAAPAKGALTPPRTPTPQPMAAAPRPLGTPTPAPAGGASGITRDETLGAPKGGVLHRVKSMLFRAPAPAPSATPSSSEPAQNSSLLHDDAPVSLVERLLALAAAQ